MLIDQAELDEAERALAVLDDDNYGSSPAGRAAALAVRGRLRLLQRQPREALEDLTGSAAVSQAIAGPTDTYSAWRIDAALAAHQLGHSEQAQDLLEQAAQIAKTTGTPTHQADMLRARARVVDSDQSLELLRQALTVLEGSQAHIERVRCLAELGAALRRTGQRAKAQQALREAREQAHHMGATRIEQQASEELRITGARPRRFATRGADALTASERRVADMAADGLSNRDIAQALFVTPRTVEQHLYNSYKKLGIQSRTELEAALRAS